MPPNNLSRRKKPSIATIVSTRHRDPCSCPEVRAYIISMMPLDGKKPLNMQECLACTTWTCGYVLVNSVVRYRTILNDTLTIGRRVPKQFLSTRHVTIVSKNDKGKTLPYGIQESKPVSARALRDRARRLLKKGA